MSSRTDFITAAGFLLVAVVFYLAETGSSLVFLNLVLAVFFAVSGVKAKRE